MHPGPSLHPREPGWPPVPLALGNTTVVFPTRPSHQLMLAPDTHPGPTLLSVVLSESFRDAVRSSHCSQAFYRFKKLLKPRP